MIVAITGYSPLKSTTSSRNLFVGFVSLVGVAQTAATNGRTCPKRSKFQTTSKEEMAMNTTLRTTKAALMAATLAGALLSLPQVSLAAAGRSGAAMLAQDDSGVAGQVQSKLNKSQFKNVNVTVQNGIATLTGTVDLYEFKADAAKRASRAKGVTAVRNEIQVTGGNIDDQALESKLRDRLAYDRVGFGNVFNAITVSVQDGVATLGGHARTYVDRDSALALVSTTQGVKDVVNEIEVDPTSIMDDQTRIAVARAIYGYPSLQRYAIDPQRPIRISVQNGNVELYGTVDTQADKEAAYLRANGVSGVFSVKNYLQVAGQPAEQPKQ
jgi:hyperosmotically inducible periplasmic protein